MDIQSAHRIPSETVDALFGIPKSELIPIIEKAAQAGPVISLEIRVEYETTAKGMLSETLVPTFSYQTASGATGEALIFVKRQLDSEAREAPFYLEAETADIPTPKYYGNRIGSQGEEILFLEFLPVVGVDKNNAGEVREMVELIARINTAPLRCAEFTIPAPIPPEQQVIRMERDVEQRLIPTLEQIWESGAAGEVGAEIERLCRENPQAIATLKRYVFALHERIVSLPEDALIQGDTGSHQMGWRRSAAGKQLVVFDLGWCVGRRFYDIADIVHDYLRDSVLSQEEIAGHYLAEYRRWGGEEVALQDFLEATHWLAEEGKLWICPWLWQTSLKQIAGGDPQVEANPNDFPTWLCNNLTELLEAARTDKVQGLFGKLR